MRSNYSAEVASETCARFVAELNRVLLLPPCSYAVHRAEGLSCAPKVGTKSSEMTAVRWPWRGASILAQQNSARLRPSCWSSVVWAMSYRGFTPSTRTLLTNRNTGCALRRTKPCRILHAGAR